MHNRHDVEWKIPDQVDWQQVSVAVLMDIRWQLKELNSQIRAVRNCPTMLGALKGALEVGRDLRRKERAAAKRRRAKRA